MGRTLVSRRRLITSCGDRGTGVRQLDREFRVHAADAEQEEVRQDVGAAEDASEEVEGGLASSELAPSQQLSLVLVSIREKWRLLKWERNSDHHP